MNLTNKDNEFVKIEFLLSGHNEVYQRQIFMFLDVIGTVGGVAGLIFPVIAIFTDMVAEHEFLIKFVKLAFIKREIDDKNSMI